MLLIYSDKFPGETFTLRAPLTEDDFKKYYHLRWEVLRKPLGRESGSEKDDGEEQSLHALIENGSQEVIGVCRLQFNNAQEAQIRSMAVHPSYRGARFGNRLLNYLEQKAKERNIEYIFLQARDIAVPFYQRNGYEVLEKTFLLYDTVQHFSMKKTL